MEIAHSADELDRIVRQGKLAVVLGVELDDLGNMNSDDDPRPDQIATEIDRLYCKGVRYIFPIHLVDSAIGGSAAYFDIFNLANLFESHGFYALGCSPDPSTPMDTIQYRYKLGNPYLSCKKVCATDLFIHRKLPTPLVLAAWNCAHKASACALAGIAIAKLHMADILEHYQSDIPSCPYGKGMVNMRGLMPLGAFAIEYMMRRGMLIDIDHMSEATRRQVIEIASRVPNVAMQSRHGYPLNTGHNGLRGYAPSGFAAGPTSEFSLTAAEYAAVGQLHGMAGVGTGGLSTPQWSEMYERVLALMGPDAGAGFGTDTNGLVVGMPPPGKTRTQTCPAIVQYSDTFPRSSLGTKTWDYNCDGFAHYGMLADVIRALPPDTTAKLKTGAEYFYETWKICEAFGSSRAHVDGFTPSFPAAPGPIACYSAGP